MRDKRLVIIVLAALVSVAVWAYAIIPGHSTLDVTVMDVGEGLCVVVHTPSGKVMVVDCGTSSWRKNEAVGESVVAPYLRRLGKDRIDVAVLSHPHSDHVSGFPALLRAMPAKLVLDINAEHSSPLYKKFLQEVKKSQATYRIAKRGQRIEIGSGVSVEILHPAPGREYSDLNNQAIVLRIVYKDAAIMLATDASEEAELDIINSGAAVRAQVLQVGHHGGADASSPEWLAAVNPSIAIISCGRRNRYGHPSAKVIKRLESFGARVYRTDRCGAVMISTDGSTIRTSTGRNVP